ncbi:hypothetical protein [Botrimarina sp.]|uniref:hypothetical protein n=1 Tax=Botrimarina sp. TaxID=2795802 RepID=UPI0032F067B2
MSRHDERIRRRKRLARRPRDRRGVLLLVVLSLLTLFLLLGTTFLVTGNQYRTASSVVEKANRTTFQPADLLDRALMQLLRDTNNGTSVIRYHSLLRDLYGVDGFVARAGVSPPTGVSPTEFAPHFAGATNADPLGPTNGQIVEFYVLDDDTRPTLEDLDFNAVGLDFGSDGLPLPHTLAPTNGYYEGCLLTFTDGPCRGSTVRVLDYQYEGRYSYGYSDPTRSININSSAAVGRLRIVAPRRSDGARLTVDGSAGLAIRELIETDRLGRRFLVNGRPFNGAGVGYNALALSSPNLVRPVPRLSAIEAFSFTEGTGDDNYGFEIALTPNSVHFNESRVAHLKPNRFIDPWQEGLQNVPGDPGSDYEYLNYVNDLTSPRAIPLYGGFAGPGDTDESYDAPDYQNMALAAQALEPQARGKVVNENGVSVDPAAYYGNATAAPQRLDLDAVTIPSFHRPALANFWFHRLVNCEWLQGQVGDPDQRVRAVLEPYDANGVPQWGLSANAAFQIASIKRKFILRPLREDHPNFDGSNLLSRYGTTLMRNALAGARLVNRATGEITFPSWEVAGPWDVDNDGDGVPDSVWVDLGLPVQQTEDGRWYKPLVAMLVEDLDGRLNLNAHGSQDELVLGDGLDDSSGPGNWLGNLARDLKRDNPADPATTPPNSLGSSEQLASGAGWGPADTSLRPVLSPTLPLANFANGGAAKPVIPGTAVQSFSGHYQYDDYARLLFGRPDPDAASRQVAAAIDVAVPFGRYGSLPGSENPSVLRLSEPGRTTRFLGQRAQVAAGTLAFVDPVTRDPRTPLDFLGYPGADAATPLGFFATPPDLRARYAEAGALTGAAVGESNLNAFDSQSLGGTRHLISPLDSPYEVNLSTSNRRLAPASLDAIRQSYQAQQAPIVEDAPYSPAELERVLRANDGDADKLADRLWNVVDGFDPDKLAAQTDVNDQIAAGQNHPISNQNFRPNSLQSIVAQSQAAINRRVVTTESWDLPAPNENWTDRLILGADGFPGVPWIDSNDDGLRAPPDLGDDDGDGLYDEGDEAIVGYEAAQDAAYDTLFQNGCDDYAVVMRATPPTPGRILDYLRYRVVLELKRSNPVRFPPNLPHTDANLSAAVNNVLYGDNTLAANNTVRYQQPYTFGGMLAPEVLAGRRMNLNRPLGDGRDNNGNGVVDEPDEAGEPFVDGNGDGLIVNNSGRREYLDLDNNALFAGEAPSTADGDYYRDANNDGGLDGFDPDDFGRDNVPFVRTDFFWNDANGDGQVTLDEVRPFDHTPGVDANGRGAVVAPGGVRVYDDQRMARQLYARHLYCLMLALMDENYLAPYDSEDPQVLNYLDPYSGRLFPGGVPSPDSSVAFRLAAELYGGDHTVDPSTLDAAQNARRIAAVRQARRLAQRKLTCRNIAQWCVNVVDFRDPDAIQTPFEYDENPWDGWNVVDTAGTPNNRNDDGVYPLDGDLTTDENYHQVRRITSAGIGDPVRVDRNGAPLTPATRRMRMLDQTRGVVWGAERPEVLLTEGLAWHDRRLEDEPGDDGTVLTATGGGDDDDDLDQKRKPKGHTFVELYNPWEASGQQPSELYSFVNRGGQLAESAGIRFDRLSNVPADRTNPLITRSPVWRIVCVEEHPLVRNSTFSAGLGGGPQVSASDDPYQPNLYEEYLDVDLNQGPWAYPVTAAASASAGTAGVAQPAMAASDEGFWAAKRAELLSAYATERDQATGARLADSDGLSVPLGVVESPPTVTDTAFPTFDRQRQPGRPPGPGQPPATGLLQNIEISSRIDGTEVGTEDIEGETVSIRVIDQRAVALKPTRYIERAFYMAPADLFETGPTAFIRRVEPNLVNPGYRIPQLSYELPLQVSGGVRGQFNQQGQRLGVQAYAAAGGSGVRVSANKFAAAIDHFDLDRNGNKREIVPLAPLLPGRHAIVGTAGALYGDANLNANERIDFFGQDARELSHRYTTVVSHPVPPNNDSASAINLGSGPKQYLSFRRFEMAPHPSSDNHQFAVRMNGSFESTLFSANPAIPTPANVDVTNFNLTAGEALTTGFAAIQTTRPVIAIPIDSFSISEPLDGYLVRQLELDPSLEKEARATRAGRAYQNVPVEEYFESGATGDASHFDEPFDLLPELIENQTTPNYRSLHLERLANPLMPWNPEPFKPDGEPNAQHVASLPVNPYLPADSHSLDLTAFNSTAKPEAENQVAAPQQSTKTVYVSDDYGPEERHRRPRGLPLRGLGRMETALGFLSNERARLGSPFAALTALEPVRLLWGQNRATTTSEWTHPNSTNNYNAQSGDTVTSLQANNQELLNYDTYSLTEPDSTSGNQYKQLNVDFPWRMSLGFLDRTWGEFFAGSRLVWSGDGGADAPAPENVRIGAVTPIGSAEINEEPPAAGPLAASGYPANPGALVDNSAPPRLHWPNRPFASAGELLQVPAWSGSRNLTRYSVFDWLYTVKPGFEHRQQKNPYNGETRILHDGLDYKPGAANVAQIKGDSTQLDGDYTNDTAEDTDNFTDVGATNRIRWRDTLGHFGHLLNFFQTARFPSFGETGQQTVILNGTPNATPSFVPRGAPHHYRLLDYVCVPSAFTATSQRLNSDVFSAASVAPNDPRAELAAPFNTVDDYREPGRVNLNTMAGRRDANEPADWWSETYDGLMRRTQDAALVDYSSNTLLLTGRLGPAFRDVALSRRGYVAPDFNPTAPTPAMDYSPRRLHPEFPTFYANPFRAPGEGANVPLIQMVQTGVDATMLRSHPLSPGADGAWGVRGQDDRTVNKTESLTNDPDPDANGLRDDAGEAGFFQNGPGLMQVSGFDQPVAQRLSRDVALTRLNPASGRRGALQDTFLEDTFREDAGDLVDIRNPAVPPTAIPRPNVEISKRVTPTPLFSGASLEPSLDTERNPLHRYSPIQQMAGQATTRSGVYAVWITIGFFEVTPARENPRIVERYFADLANNVFAGNTDEMRARAEAMFHSVYPGGWTLGRELDFDTGQNRRHRGFYIVDRTRPVAFRPGEDANADEAVLLRRRIE